MALDMLSSSIGVSREGMFKVKDGIKLYLIDESVNSINKNVESLKANIDNYWHGASAKAFALKTETEKAKIVTILKVLEQKMEIDLGVMATNSAIADAEVATAIWGLNGGLGASPNTGGGSTPAPVPQPATPEPPTQDLQEDPTSTPEKDNQEAADIDVDGTEPNQVQSPVPSETNETPQTDGIIGEPAFTDDPTGSQGIIGEPAFTDNPTGTDGIIGEPAFTDDPTGSQGIIGEPAYEELPTLDGNAGDTTTEETGNTDAPIVPGEEAPAEDNSNTDAPIVPGEEAHSEQDDNSPIVNPGEATAQIEQEKGEQQLQDNEPTSSLVPGEEAPAEDNSNTDTPIVPGEEAPTEQEDNSPIVNPGEATAQIEQEKGEQQLQDNEPSSSLVPGEEAPAEDNSNTDTPIVPGEEAPTEQTESTTPVVNPGAATAALQQEVGQQQQETQQPQQPSIQPGSETAAYQQQIGEAQAAEAAAQQAAQSASRQAATITAAESWLNTPYLYGGEGKNGIDCSSFIQHVAASVGVELPRTTDTQIKCGSSIDKSELKPGDLIFTNNGDHVVMYAGEIDGVPCTIGASSTGGKVKYVPLQYHSGIIDYRRIPGLN